MNSVQNGDNINMEPAPIPRTSPAAQFSMDQLESALMDADDLIARMAVPYFIIGETVRQMVNNEKLSGTGIDIGIRGNEFTGTARSTLKTLQPEVEITKEGFNYLWQGTPVRVYFIDPDNEFFKRGDKVWHNAWEYMIPNPIKEYLATL